MLGHTSAKMTLDAYADLFDDDVDAVAVTLRARYSLESVPKMCPLGVCGGWSANMKPSFTSANAVPHWCGRRDSNPHALPSAGT
jgi:hypothetical protein